MNEVPLTAGVPLNLCVNAKGAKTVNVKTSGHEEKDIILPCYCA